MKNDDTDSQSFYAQSSDDAENVIIGESSIEDGTVPSCEQEQEREKFLRYLNVLMEGIDLRTNTYPKKVSLHLTLTNNATAAELGVYVFSAGVPVSPFPVQTLATGTTAVTNSITVLLGPGDYFALTNLAAGRLNVQTNLGQIWQ